MLVLVVLAVLVSGTFVKSEPSWETLRVTWGVNLLSSNVFAKIPMIENEAKSTGFSQLNNDCAGGTFLGYRFMKGTDTAAIPLYDVNGYIAGIQFGIPKNVIRNVTLHNYENIPAFQIDKISSEDVYFLTAYFVDPNLICSRSRTELQLTGLYLQNGSDPIRESIEIPLYEKDIANTKWVKGQCFRSMGVHYWYDFHEDMDCNALFPFTVIYNRGKLTVFAFSAPGYHRFSKRLEHPPKISLPQFFPLPIPKCVLDEYETSGGYSTMHVYFNVKFWNLLC